MKILKSKILFLAIILLTVGVILLPERKPDTKDSEVIEEPLGGIETLSVQQDFLSEIVAVKDTYISQKGYVDKKWEDFLVVPAGTKIISYKTPKGEIGYQVIFEWEKDGIKHLKSVGYGVESVSRTFDNEQSLIDLSTATST